MPSLLLSFLLVFSLAGCSSAPPTIQNSSNFISYTMVKAPIVGTTLSEQKIELGGFSGLQFLESKEGALFFQALTDRGPLAKVSDKIDRTFLLPEYTPQIVTLKADLKTRELLVVNQLKLRKKDGQFTTGLPHDRKEENPKDVSGLYYSLDPEGLDSEAFVSDGEGGWWIGDEYFPGLIHFDREGKWLSKLEPGNGLPRMYRERKPNLGFEAIARTGNRLYGFLQSPLPEEKPPYEKSARIVEVDLESMKISAEYFYPFAEGNHKIGDAISAGAQKVLVLEQNGKTGKESQKFVYLISFDQPESAVKKTLVLDLKSTPLNEVEKVEGLAFIDDHHLAFVIDNDFQVAGSADAKGLIPFNGNSNQLVVVELKDGIETFTKTP